MTNILLPTPRIYPSVLYSIAGETTARKVALLQNFHIKIQEALPDCAYNSADNKSLKHVRPERGIRRYLL